MAYDSDDETRWIGQLNKLYRTIVTDPGIPPENLDKANEIVLETIERLRPLTQKTLNG